jgi:hypothetical protein
MNHPTREELQKLAAALRGLAALLGDNPDAYHEIALGLDAVFDCHLQRIEQLERRCGELADELSEARDRLNDLDGQKRYNY